MAILLHSKLLVIQHNSQHIKHSSIINIKNTFLQGV